MSIKATFQLLADSFYIFVYIHMRLNIYGKYVSVNSNVS